MRLFLSDITTSFEIDNTKVKFTTFDGKQHTRKVKRNMSLVPCYSLQVVYKTKHYEVR